jgi:hypothetical protein
MHWMIQIQWVVWRAILGPLVRTELSAASA